MQTPTQERTRARWPAPAEGMFHSLRKGSRATQAAGTTPPAGHRPTGGGLGSGAGGHAPPRRTRRSSDWRWSQVGGMRWPLPPRRLTSYPTYQQPPVVLAVRGRSPLLWERPSEVPPTRVRSNQPTNQAWVLVGEAPKCLGFTGPSPEKRPSSKPPNNPRYSGHRGTSHG